MFQEFSTLSVSANNGIQLIEGIPSSDCLINLDSFNTFQSGNLIEAVVNSGNVFRIRWVQGTLKGKLIPLSYGETELTLDVPDLSIPFNLELIPSRLQFEYSVEIFTRVFDPIYSELSDRLGIPLEVLQKIPLHTLKLLEGLNQMAQSDTRNVLEAIEQQGQTILNQGTTIASQQALLDAANAKLGTVETELVTVKTESLIQEEFKVIQSDFVQIGNRWVAFKTLEELNGSKSVQMSCVDNDGDEQGFSQLIHPYQGDIQKAAVELSANQYADNAYPLTFLVQGNRKIVSNSAASGNWEPLPGGTRDFRVLNGVLSNTEDGGINVNVMGTEVVDAFIYVQDSQIWAKNVAGEYAIYAANGAYISAGSQVAYDTRKIEPSSIALVPPASL